MVVTRFSRQLSADGRYVVGYVMLSPAAGPGTRRTSFGRFVSLRGFTQTEGLSYLGAFCWRTSTMA